MSTTTPSSAFPRDSEPSWEIAKLFPAQGHWTEGSYLSFTESLSQIVELVDGHVEVHGMPTRSHQKIVSYLLTTVLTFLQRQGLGDAVSALYRVRMRDETYREPDVTVYLAESFDRFGERFGQRPDVVMEVVSSDVESRSRDYQDKRRDYEEAGIPEYWIVDPAERRISVLTLSGGTYSTSAQYGVTDSAASRILVGFTIDVANVIAAAEVRSK